MAVPRAGAVGGRNGGQPVTGGVRGSARAAARRVPQGTKAELPARLRREPAGASRPPRRVRPTPSLRPPGRADSYGINALSGALRAPLKTRRKFSPHRDLDIGT